MTLPLKLSKTQERIMTLLGDGNYHTATEIRQCLNDDLALPNTVRVHLFHLRQRLQNCGMEIACETVGKYVRYRLVQENEFLTIVKNSD